ncbi:MAG: tetratricopeptide repeat protein [Vicinamibacteria bacterium]|nr:tetratricopeptide repeat protein [Vicinamibacteria bacterium]
MPFSPRVADGSRRRRTPLAGVGLAVLLLTACAREPQAPRPSTPPPQPPRPSVAVIGSGEAAGLGTLLVESLRADLAGDPGLRVVTATRAALAAGSGALDAERAEAARHRLAVDAVAWATVNGDSGRLAIRVGLVGPRGTAARDVWSGERGEDALLDAAAAAGEALLAALGRPRPQRDRAHPELPPGLEAARLYATGLEHLRSHAPRRAQEALQRSAALAPGHPLVHAALAEAWERLGYDRLAGEASERAHRLAGGLQREDRLVLEAQWRRRRGDPARAALLYQGLQRLFPDQPEYAVEAIRAQLAAGQWRPALRAIEAARASGLADPDLDLAEAEAAHGLGEYARSEAAASRAEAAGRARDASGLVARALVQRSLALRDLGQLPAALQAAEDARALFEAAGDPGGVAQALNWRGTIERRHGRLAEARATYEAALALAQRIGDERRATLARNQLAVLLRQQGELRAASRRHEEVLTAYRAMGDVEGMTIALSSAGWVRRQLAEIEPARALLREALALAQQSGHRMSEAIAHNTLAWVAFDAGEFAAARAGFERALALNLELRSLRSVGFTRVGLAQVALAGGDLPVARREAEESRRVRERLGEHGGVAESLATLAEVALVEGRFVEAEALAAQSARTWRAQGERDALAWAEALHAAALHAAGREAEADPVRARAAAGAARSEQPRVRLRVALVDAWLQATGAGRIAAGLEQAEGARLEAERRGLRGIALEARLVSAALDRRFGALARDAQQAGFLVVARRAEAERPGAAR